MADHPLPMCRVHRCRKQADEAVFFILDHQGDILETVTMIGEKAPAMKESCHWSLRDKFIPQLGILLGIVGHLHRRHKLESGNLSLA